MKSIKKRSIQKPTWLPEATEPGLSDMLSEHRNRLSLRAFSGLLRNRLKQNDYEIRLSRQLVKSLHEIAVRGLPLRLLLPKARKRTETEAWRKQRSFIRKFIRAASTAKASFRAICVPKDSVSTKSSGSQLPLSVQQRVDAFFDGLIEELELVERLMKNEQAIISSYLKPTVQSQILFTMDGAIRRSGSYKEEERLLILKACMVAGGLVTDRVPDTTAIRARLRRVKQSIGDDARKYKREE